MRQELAEESKQAHQKVTEDIKVQQQIRLIINAIASDNFEKKF